jgi:hypothetical protein
MYMGLLSCCMKYKKTTKSFAKLQMQISTSVLVTSITAVIAIGFFISSPIVSVQATTTAVKMPSNAAPTLGSPSVVYIESDKSSPFRALSINGTHAQATAFTGNGTLAGMPDIDTGTAYLVTGSDGSVYTFGKGAIVSKVGSGTLTYTFDAIGHYLQDGKLHDTGHIIVKSTSGNLASFSDKIGLYKDWYDASGNGMTTMSFWKG